MSEHVMLAPAALKRGLGPAAPGGLCGRPDRAYRAECQRRERGRGLTAVKDPSFDCFAGSASSSRAPTKKKSWLRCSLHGAATQRDRLGGSRFAQRLYLLRRVSTPSRRSRPRVSEATAVEVAKQPLFGDGDCGNPRRCASFMNRGERTARVGRGRPSNKIRSMIAADLRWLVDRRLDLSQSVATQNGSLTFFRSSWRN